jgi:2-polyprenyl-3-methyl-5-hydroxy-6-metoxy-1,4-benzoquinol methylase
MNTLKQIEADLAGSVAFPETADIETSSNDYARRFAGEAGAWLLQVQTKATLQMLAHYPRARVLDVGGGHGQLALPLIERGYEVTVLGSDAVCQQRIQSLVNQKQCHFQVGNVLALPYPDRAFDVVLSYRFLAHVTQWQPFLTELCRVAKTVVMVDYPTVKSVNYIAPQLFRLKKGLEGNTRPFTCYQESDLLEVFQQQGFEGSDRFAQFFLPMVLHRSLQNPQASTLLEQVFRTSGLTQIFGSPVILKLLRKGES